MHKSFLVNITIARGVLSLALGVMVLIQPVMLRPFIVNFMGVYWLLGGIVSLRLAKTAPRAKGLRLVVGIAGVVAGLALLARSFTVGYVPISVLIPILGLLILLSGVLHILVGVRIREKIGQSWEYANLVLGGFEVIFGLLVLLYPWFQFEMAYLSIVMWAIMGGIIMVADGLRLRRLLREQEQMSNQ